jgi:hypothetical protein
MGFSVSNSLASQSTGGRQFALLPVHTEVDRSARLDASRLHERDQLRPRALIAECRNCRYHVL